MGSRLSNLESDLGPVEINPSTELRADPPLA